MSKKANPTIIGVFVIGALILVVVGVLTFGSGKLFSEKSSYVLFFDEPIDGLSVGAPVRFRGVDIGAVTRIKLRFDENDMSMDIPVFIETEPDRFHAKDSVPEKSKILEKRRRTKEEIEVLIKKGLRAQLQTDSLVTGKLFIAVDMYPDKPLRLLGAVKDYQEIPTILSGMEQLTKTIEELPLEELVDKTMSAVEGIDKLVNSPDLTASISAMRLALEGFGKMAKNVDGQVDPIAESFRNTAKSATETLEQVTLALEEIRNLTGKNSPIYYEVNQAFEDLSETARSISILADYIQRHPETLIRGKKKTGGN
jgi:paraquat-inducible protein B